MWCVHSKKMSPKTYDGGYSLLFVYPSRSLAGIVVVHRVTSVPWAKLPSSLEWKIVYPWTVEALSNSMSFSPSIIPLQSQLLVHLATHRTVQVEVDVLVPTVIVFVARSHLHSFRMCDIHRCERD